GGAGSRRRPASAGRAHMDVIIVGAGVIGLGIAWRAAQRGLAVRLVAPAPGSGATRTAAGMLAPATELHYGEEALLRLGLESARCYASFVAELEGGTGRRVGYRRDGTVVAAWDAADLAGLRDLHAFGQSLGLSMELVTGRELRRLEPALASGLPGGLVAADDCQVDNRLLQEALLAAAELAGAPIPRKRGRSGGGHEGGLAAGGVLRAAAAVVAAGARGARRAGA